MKDGEENMNERMNIHVDIGAERVKGNLITSL